MEIAGRENLVRLEICEKMSHGFEKSNDFSVGGMFGDKLQGVRTKFSLK